MSPATCITTSWDDGHPLDLRVADLLAKHGLPGTFYVPRSSEYGTMAPAQVRELSGHFEVGAHTLEHVDLSTASEQQAWQEIGGSRSWVEDCTGAACPMFCPPKGKFSAAHLRMMRLAGYAGTRGVELLSLDFPRPVDGLMLMPTTVQAHPHGRLAYARNALRRYSIRNLWLLLARGHWADWAALARSLLERALRRGGVFHLWGHSWEVEQTGQWQRLEDVFRFLSEYTRQAPTRTNGQLCQPAPATPAEVLR
jgi:peptidoglycan/xylan/chitin deacetylase (PgdA/CDA1 family)